MLKLSEYWQHAAACRQMATTIKDADHRRQLEEMAAAWEMLANEREKFLKKIGQYPEEA